MSGPTRSWVSIAAELDGSAAEADLELLRAELEDVRSDLAVAEVEAEDLRVERDELLNELKELRLAVAAHRTALQSRDWGTSAKVADETLWKVLG